MQLPLFFIALLCYHFGLPRDICLFLSELIRSIYQVMAFCPKKDFSLNASSCRAPPLQLEFQSKLSYLVEKVSYQKGAYLKETPWVECEPTKNLLKFTDGLL